MTDSLAFSIPLETGVEPLVCLKKSISAIQLLPNENGGGKLGLLSQLGPGSTIKLCGDGFNDRTMKVAFNQRFYFVFVQDVQAQE